eukprot:CAMPEP_0180652714 /NCGR_PEP_ID=MMETSP1037_2-20121125/53652_1 /TAXON_ID=632150 /ORGANISM="Azadinium spinosum, Strain 3D9" /LENGTH=84 /DNA_ID=CAMNT_0022678621 /DNA_START=42 /DNA_END=292 /DNA_ORIENTATION=+
MPGLLVQNIADVHANCTGEKGGTWESKSPCSLGLHFKPGAPRPQPRETLGNGGLEVCQGTTPPESIVRAQVMNRHCVTRSVDVT